MEYKLTHIIKSRSPGMSLIEVLIVVVLLSLSFTFFLKGLDTARIVRTTSELRTIQATILNSIQQEIRARRFDENTSSPWSTFLGKDTYTDACLSFDGNNDYVNLGSANSLSISDGITVTAWVYNNGGSGHLVNQGGGWDDPGYSMFWYGNNIRIELQNSSQKTISDNSAPSTGSWNHIAFTWETNSNIIKTYINGNQRPSTKTFNGPIGQPSENLNIARKEQNGYYFNGRIDDITIWNIAKTQAEIQSYMNSNPNGSESGLVGFWDLDENSGSSIIDNSNNTNNGTIIGATWLVSNQSSESSIGLWDDIDDFDGYTILSFPKHQAFSCSVAVKYVDPSSGFHTSISSPTNYKSVIVKVFHPTISTMIDSMIIGQGL
ncbi:MAG: hypothetical protein CMG62_08580 [Candidatus Marinimicrobia bacterium]|nr:hypothetical protein [Candidatus Neomarinimicrobiota bacterium]|tara:strand:+ start:1229 stop:2359 length:1131 start_codon:yes stop_codon:yes gene_type:complete